MIFCRYPFIVLKNILDQLKIYKKIIFKFIGCLDLLFLLLFSKKYNLLVFIFYLILRKNMI